MHVFEPLQKCVDSNIVKVRQQKTMIGLLLKKEVLG